MYADYSGGRPTGAQLKAAEFDGVIRYIGLGGAGKRLTAAEYRDLTAAGVTVLLVAELGTGDTWGTSSDDDYGRGRANASAALADARACGVPEDKIFIFAASDAHAAAQWQINDTVAYVRGFRDILGVSRTGHYGFSETNFAVHNAGVASGFWRCGSQPSSVDKAWVNFWQRNAAPTTKVVAGVACDINDVYNLVQEDDMQQSDMFQPWDPNIISGTGGKTSVNQWMSGVLGRLDALATSTASLTKMVVANEANDVTAESLAAALVPAVLPQLSQALHDAVGTVADVALTPEQIQALAAATVAAFGAKLT